MSATTTTFIPPSQSTDGRARLKLSRETWYVRFYLWLYEANPNNIDTCKLLWAYVFFLPALVLKAVLSIFVFVAELAEPYVDDIRERRAAKRPTLEEREAAFDAQIERKRVKQEAKAAAGPSRMESILERVANSLSYGYAKIAPSFRYIGIAVGTLIGLAIVAGLVWLAITETSAFMLGLLVTVGILAICALVVFIIVKREKRPKKVRSTPRFVTVLKRLGHGFHNHTCAKVDLS